MVVERMPSLESEGAELSEPSVHPASFRDPSGFVFYRSDGTLLRQINRSARADFDSLVSSGLYDELVRRRLLIEHQETSLSFAMTDDASCIIQPCRCDFISYPYEWSFSALKDAALLTLELQRRALRHGMTLKDASAYNVQFQGCQPVFVDTLSFERRTDDSPWRAYKQFCQHFLAPLLLMAKVDISLNRLGCLHLEGVPLPLASRLLPLRTWLNPGVFFHIHLHSRFERWYGGMRNDQHYAEPQRSNQPKRPVSQEALEHILRSLAKIISRLKWVPTATEWADYYSDNRYSNDDFDLKKSIVESWIAEINPRMAWDLGANTGVFSRIATQQGATCVAFDLDPGCVELNYRQGRDEQTRTLLPLLLDLANPSPAIGWEHKERDSLANRGRADLLIALALVHHLRVSANIPFKKIAELFGKLGRHLIIEYVDRDDPQTHRLMRSREHEWGDYDVHSFETAFAAFFKVTNRRPMGDSGRVMYLMESHN